MTAFVRDGHTCLDHAYMTDGNSLTESHRHKLFDITDRVSCHVTPFFFLKVISSRDVFLGTTSKMFLSCRVTQILVVFCFCTWNVDPKDARLTRALLGPPQLSRPVCRRCFVCVRACVCVCVCVWRYTLDSLVHGFLRHLSNVAVILCESIPWPGPPPPPKKKILFSLLFFMFTVRMFKFPLLQHFDHKKLGRASSVLHEHPHDLQNNCTENQSFCS